jgi:hypothetical protein
MEKSDGAKTVWAALYLNPRKLFALRDKDRTPPMLSNIAGPKPG